MFGGSSGWKWVASRVSLAIDKSLAVFRGAKQFSISLDPSTHSGVENCVCVAYMWHAGKGVIPPSKIIPRGKTCIPHGVEMSDELAAIVAARKAQRWASYKEIRALSDILSDLTGYEGCIATLVLQNDWIVRPVASDEFRLVSPTTHVAIVCQVCDDSIVARKQELPDDLHTYIDDIPYLVLCIDQGSIGMAAVHFLLSLGVVLDTRFDMFHRAVNDVSLAAARACKGLFRKTMLFTAHVFALNYGPFNQGPNFDEKRQMLEFFFSQLDHMSLEFRKYAVRYANAMGMPCTTDAGFMDIFESFADMPSFNFKGPLPKLARRGVGGCRR